MARDKRNDEKLFQMGWTVIHYWGKEVLKKADACAEKVMSMIPNDR